MLWVAAAATLSITFHRRCRDAKSWSESETKNGMDLFFDSANADGVLPIQPPFERRPFKQQTVPIVRRNLEIERMVRLEIPVLKDGVVDQAACERVTDAGDGATQNAAFVCECVNIRRILCHIVRNGDKLQILGQGIVLAIVRNRPSRPPTQHTNRNRNRHKCARTNRDPCDQPNWKT
jgi:hypothetical protein